MPKQDTRLRLRKDVNDSLEYYIHDNAKELSSIGGFIDVAKTKVANEILMNFLADKGHYPPKYSKQGMKRLMRDLDKIEKKETAISLEEAMAICNTSSKRERL